MGAAEVEALLPHLAVARRCRAPTQNQAKSVVLFLYKERSRRTLKDPLIFNIIRQGSMHVVSGSCCA